MAIGAADVIVAFSPHRFKHRNPTRFCCRVAWRNFCNGASMEAYSTSDCDLHGAPPPTRRPEPAHTPAPVPAPSPAPDKAPDPPTSLLPATMTNGHSRRRPSSNILERTSSHNKSRLKPYRRGRAGWKAPKTTRQRQRVTWGPRLLKLISTTPIPPRSRPNTGQWRPTSSSSFTSSSSYSSSAGSSSLYSSSSSSSSFSSSGGSPHQDSVFLSDQTPHDNFPI